MLKRNFSSDTSTKLCLMESTFSYDLGFSPGLLWRCREKHRQHKLMCGFARKNYTFYSIYKDIGENNKCPGFRLPCFSLFQSQDSSRKGKGCWFYINNNKKKMDKSVFCGHAVQVNSDIFRFFLENISDSFRDHCIPHFRSSVNKKH